MTASSYQLTADLLVCQMLGAKGDHYAGKRGRARYLQLVRESKNWWAVGDHGRFTNGKMCAVDELLDPVSDGKKRTKSGRKSKVRIWCEVFVGVAV